MKNFDAKGQSLRSLTRLKKEKGLRIGICVPTLNEAGNIRRTIQAIKECQSLVDELIVIDSGSTDETVNIAASENVAVISDEACVESLDCALFRGKGFNLWSSLYFLSTDIVLWIDADIENIDKYFVAGLVSPFLEDERVKFVKGYYDRPKNGARLTEIMVRPFTNFFFPELNGFIQPLSGEYGGRRDVLESLHFYSGFSVEIGLLIQLVLMLSGQEIAQVNLGQKFHKSQDSLSLGYASAKVMRNLLNMAHDAGRLKLLGELPSYLLQYEILNSETKAEIRELVDAKIMPISENGYYREKFNKTVAS